MANKYIIFSVHNIMFFKLNKNTRYYFDLINKKKIQISFKIIDYLFKNNCVKLGNKYTYIKFPL